MPRISLQALIIAFAAEILVDLFVNQLVFGMFAGDRLVSDMGEQALLELAKNIMDTTIYLPVMFTFGSLTTVAGAYLAARLAKRIPYYHGLAMGIIGLLFSAFFWSEEPNSLDYLGLLITIPLSLLGAHLARKRMLELKIL